MVNLSGAAVVALICSMLGFGAICWIAGFLLGRCCLNNIDDDVFVPKTVAIPIVDKSTGSSS
jgi:hypothetical protein